MTRPPDAIPLVPRPAALALRPLPLAPLGLALTLLAQRVARDHPGLFRRLGPHARGRFLIDPTDLPFALLLDLSRGSPQVSAHRAAPPATCRIGGPLAALVGMVHGAYDGDALFFSRDLTIEGDTAAALALRNAIDDAELDLFDEATAAIRPFAGPLRPLLAAVERATGLALHRVDGARP